MTTNTKKTLGYLGNSFLDFMEHVEEACEHCGDTLSDDGVIYYHQGNIICGACSSDLNGETSDYYED